MIKDNLIQVRPCQQKEIASLVAAAKEDKHELLAPGWLVWKGKEIAGSFSTVPTVLLWLNTKLMKGRDSLVVMQVYENLLRSQGHTVMALPCVEDSPLTPYLEPLGYVDAKTKLYLKSL